MLTAIVGNSRDKILRVGCTTVGGSSSECGGKYTKSTKLVGNYFLFFLTSIKKRFHQW
jgi:hypothetical protein